MNLNISKYKHNKTWFITSEIRNNLYKHINYNDRLNILEIGCYEGLGSCAFSDNLLEHPNSTLHCVDPFILTNTCKEITTLYVTNDIEDTFKNNIMMSKNYKKIFFNKMTSDDFFNINKKKFNLIYIDGCHTQEQITKDMENSFKILEIGGIMWMDDYLGGDNRCCQIPMNNFLSKYINNYIIIHKNYQLAIKKIC
jgi:hypothetical protein